MITRKQLEQTLLELPTALIERREHLRGDINPGGCFGVRPAANMAGVCQSVFYRAEKGEINNIEALLKLLSFIEKDGG